MTGGLLKNKEKLAAKCRGFFFLCLAIFVLFAPAIARAAGTLAGTEIVNGNVSIRVRQNFGLELKGPDYAGALPSGGSFYFPFTIANAGNGSDTYNITLYGTTTGWSAALIVDENNNGIHEPGEKAAAKKDIILSEDGEYTVFLVLSAPDTAVDGEEGSAVLNVSGSVDDGGPYMGMNGIFYGGRDHVSEKVTARVVNSGFSAPGITEQLFLLRSARGSGPFDPAKGEKFTLNYFLSARADITLLFHDLLGNIKWEKIFKAGVEQGAEAGENRVFWDGRDGAGKSLSNGIYFYKIIHDGKVLGKGEAKLLGAERI